MARKKQYLYPARVNLYIKASNKREAMLKARKKFGKENLIKIF